MHTLHSPSYTSFIFHLFFNNNNNSRTTGQIQPSFPFDLHSLRIFPIF